MEVLQLLFMLVVVLLFMVIILIKLVQMLFTKLRLAEQLQQYRHLILIPLV